jgi:hypothetical protein
VKVGFRIRDEPFADGAGVCEVDGELRVAVCALRCLFDEPAWDSLNNLPQKTPQGLTPLVG